MLCTYLISNPKLLDDVNISCIRPNEDVNNTHFNSSAATTTKKNGMLKFNDDENPVYWVYWMTLFRYNVKIFSTFTFQISLLRARKKVPRCQFWVFDAWKTKNSTFGKVQSVKRYERIVWHCEKAPVKNWCCKLLIVCSADRSQETWIFQGKIPAPARFHLIYYCTHSIISFIKHLLLSLSLLCGVVNNASSVPQRKNPASTKKKVFRLESIFTARASPHTYLKRDFYCSKLRPKWAFRNTFFSVICDERGEKKKEARRD